MKFSGEFGGILETNGNRRKKGFRCIGGSGDPKKVEKIRKNTSKPRKNLKNSTFSTIYGTKSYRMAPGEWFLVPGDPGPGQGTSKSRKNISKSWKNHQKSSFSTILGAKSYRIAPGRWFLVPGDPGRAISDAGRPRARSGDLKKSKKYLKTLKITTKNLHFQQY